MLRCRKRLDQEYLRRIWQMGCSFCDVLFVGIKLFGWKMV